MTLDSTRLAALARAPKGEFEVQPPSVWAYVFITTTNPGPRRAVQQIRRIPGVVRADALFGAPDVVAIVAGDDLLTMDAVIDTIAELPEVTATDSKVARWISDD